ncbi:hypothetical protein L1F30_12270 [Simiduia sp. 21SJ11W-1]|uniref:hypothetical protein n=1 Tax=Simiduia sp. 21SJ11W-1 TaxID=2909669 RepID=UPI00209DF304|nr:hypothetical protein [Simiduia sp. 21SJ11W-1]UTA46936.1 hypothetical protein L1F30_12270 [Simiduia sp. 21SJ11W-1]
MNKKLAHLILLTLDIGAILGAYIAYQHARTTLSSISMGVEEIAFESSVFYYFFALIIPALHATTLLHNIRRRNTKHTAIINTGLAIIILTIIAAKHMATNNIESALANANYKPCEYLNKGKFERATYNKQC